MCITFFYINSSAQRADDLKFVLLFNREEVLSRETLPLAQFAEDGNILAGRDARAQGTWLGINTLTGNVSFLTNRVSLAQRFKTVVRRALSLPATEKSRGGVVLDALHSDFYARDASREQCLYDYALRTFAHRGEYLGFNAIFGDLRQMAFYYVTNRERQAPQRVPDGFHTMCNYANLAHRLRKQDFWAAEFEKAVRACDSGASGASGNAHATLVDTIEEMARDKRQFGAQWSYLQSATESSLFIPRYYGLGELRGSKSTSIIVVDGAGRVTYREV